MPGVNLGKLYVCSSGGDWMPNPGLKACQGKTFSVVEIKFTHFSQCVREIHLVHTFCFLNLFTLVSIHKVSMFHLSFC